jgi:hypothetical protein
MSTLTRRKTELHDLPTELLLRILEYLSDSDLYSISFHSPRLHHLAISVYLSHHEIFDDGFAAISEESGLQLTSSLQVAALPGIILLAFSDSIFEDGLGIREKEKGVHKPEVLIKRMSRVRQIILDFDDIDVWSLQQIFSGGPIPSSLQEWSKVVWSLIRTLGKEEYISFNIRIGKQYITEMRPEGYAGVLTSAAKGPSLYKAAVGRRWKRRVSSVVHPSAVEDIGSEVKRTDLLSNIADVFVAPINSYPIEHLSLGAFEMESSTWATLLPFIDLPNLRTFRFSSLTLPFIHISKFLARHPRLTSLTLKGELRDPNQMVISPQICFSSPISISFPALRILEATSDYITHHLTHCRFSMLDQVVVWPSLGNVGGFHTVLHALCHFQRKILLRLHLTGVDPRFIYGYMVPADDSCFALHCVKCLELHLTRCGSVNLLQPWYPYRGWWRLDDGLVHKQWINSRYFPSLRELRIVSPGVSRMSADQRVRMMGCIKSPCPDLKWIGLATDVASLETYCARCYRCMSLPVRWQCRYGLWYVPDTISVSLLSHSFGMSVILRRSSGGTCIMKIMRL